MKLNVMTIALSSLFGLIVGGPVVIAFWSKGES